MLLTRRNRLSDDTSAQHAEKGVRLLFSASETNIFSIHLTIIAIYDFLTYTATHAHPHLTLYKYVCQCTRTYSSIFRPFPAQNNCGFV